MSDVTAEFGDFSVSGSCATLDATTTVPIYEFSAEKDGAYTVSGIVAAWQVGGAGVQYAVQLNWKVIAGVLSVDGPLFIGGVGALAPAGITTDVNAGKARVLVAGIAAQPLLWRLKGDRFDLTA